MIEHFFFFLSSTKRKLNKNLTILVPLKINLLKIIPNNRIFPNASHKYLYVAPIPYEKISDRSIRKNEGASRDERFNRERATIGNPSISKKAEIDRNRDETRWR